MATSVKSADFSNGIIKTKKNDLIDQLFLSNKLCGESVNILWRLNLGQIKNSQKSAVLSIIK